MKLKDDLHRLIAPAFLAPSSIRATYGVPPPALLLEALDVPGSQARTLAQHLCL
jgi:hypothetical protein